MHVPSAAFAARQVQFTVPADLDAAAVVVVGLFVRRGDEQLLPRLDAFRFGRPRCTNQRRRRLAGITRSVLAVGQVHPFFSCVVVPPVHDIQQTALAFHVDVIGEPLDGNEPPRLQFPQPPFSLGDEQGGVVDKIHAPRCFESVDNRVDTEGQIAALYQLRCGGFEPALGCGLFHDECCDGIDFTRREGRAIGGHAQQLVAFFNDAANRIGRAAQFPIAVNEVPAFRTVATAAPLRVGFGRRGLSRSGVDPTQ